MNMLYLTCLGPSNTIFYLDVARSFVVCSLFFLVHQQLEWVIDIEQCRAFYLVEFNEYFIYVCGLSF